MKNIKYAIFFIFVLIVFQSLTVMSGYGYLQLPDVAEIKLQKQIDKTEQDKKSICRTMVLLYQRATNEKRKISWDDLFYYLSLHMGATSNNINRENLLTEAKQLCPNYEKGKEVVNRV